MASASIVLAVYSSANGLAAAAMAAAISFALPIGRITRSIIALVACLSIAGYFADYRSQMLDDGMRASLASWEDLLHFVIFIATFLGAVEQKGLVTTIGFGLVGFAFWSALTFLTIRLHLQSRRTDLNAIVLLLLADICHRHRSDDSYRSRWHGRRTGNVIALWHMDRALLDITRRCRQQIAILGRGERHQDGYDIVGHLVLQPQLPFKRAVCGSIEHTYSGHRLCVCGSQRGRDIDDQSLAYISPDTVSIIPLIEFLRERRLSIFAD